MCYSLIYQKRVRDKCVLNLLCGKCRRKKIWTKTTSKYDQQMPQLQIADQSRAPQGRITERT